MDKGLQGGKIMQGKFSDYLLVSDMDATLLDDNHTISEENRQAIDYFIKNGGRFTVATGRMVEAVRAYMPNLHINAPAYYITVRRYMTMKKIVRYLNDLLRKTENRQ